MSNKITLTSNKYNNRYLELVCTQTQDIANNQSTIKWTLTSTGDSGTYYGIGPTTVKINNEEVYYKARLNPSSVFPSKTGSTSGEIVVKHNSDGNLTIPVSLSTAIYTQTVSTKSANWELDDIPRAATLDGVPANFTDEATTLTILYTNKSGENVDGLDACIAIPKEDGSGWYDGIAAYRAIGKTDSSYIFRLTDAERTNMRKYVSSADGKAKVRFYVRTTIGTSKFYKSIESELRLVNFEPTLNPTIKDVGIISTQLTGNPQKIIKGFNSIQYDIGAAGRKEGYITNQRITCGSTTTTEPTGILENVSSGLFELRAIDNRGTIVETTRELEVIDYIPLTCNITGASISLTDETICAINFDVVGNYWSGNFGAAANELTLKFRYKRDNEDYCEWKPLTPIISEEHATYSFNGTVGNLDYKGTYTIQVGAYDKAFVEGIFSKEVVLKTIPVFDWGEEDFNFNVPVKIENKYTMIYPIEEGTSDGWTYIKWSNGIGECWKTLEHATAIDTAWGSLYCGTPSSRQAYPFTFSERPTEQVSLCAGQYQGILYPDKDTYGINNKTHTARYNICRPSSVASSTFYISYYIRGRFN